jgi:hypothetical protein
MDRDPGQLYVKATLESLFFQFRFRFRESAKQLDWGIQVFAFVTPVRIEALQSIISPDFRRRFHRQERCDFMSRASADYDKPRPLHYACQKTANSGKG